MNDKDRRDHEDMDDAALFARAMEGVNRTHRNDRQQRAISHHRENPRIIPASAGTVDPPTVDITDQGESVLFVRSGLQHKVIKRLKRGGYPYESVLDLHGMRRHQAEKCLDEFLAEAIQDNLSCVLIIHGKGWHSENRTGVLKPLTIDWLKQKAEIKAFCSASSKDGGTGAVYVLLKRGLTQVD